MRKVKKLLGMGYDYFGSGSYNSEEFNSFFKLFKKSFTAELKKLSATEIEFSKGHFYLSGFFRVGEQLYYFSISDVRTPFGRPESMLIRTAKHNKDWTGGANNYVKIDSGMFKEIARTFGIDIPTNELNSNDISKDDSEIAFQEILNLKKQKGNNFTFEKKMPSLRKANDVVWKLKHELNLNFDSITVWKWGNKLSHAGCDNDLFEYKFDYHTKKLTIVFK